MLACRSAPGAELKRSVLEAAFFDTLAAAAASAAQDLYATHGPIWKQQGRRARPECTGIRALHSQTEGAQTEQSAKGKIGLAEGGRPLITLFKDADFSTLIHEGAHNYLEIMGNMPNIPTRPAPQ